MGKPNTKRGTRIRSKDVLTPEFKMAESEPPETEKAASSRFESTNKLLKKTGEVVFGSKGASPEEEKLRGELIKTTKSVNNLHTIVKENTTVLTSLIESNKDVKSFSKKDQGVPQYLIDRLEKGEEITEAQGKTLNNSLDDANKALGAIKDSGIELQGSLGELLTNSINTINLDKDSGKDIKALMLKQVDFAEKNTTNAPVLEALASIKSELIKTNDGDKAALKVLNKSLKVDVANKVNDVKVSGTLAEIEKNIEGIGLSNTDLGEMLERKDGSGKSIISKGLAATGAKKGMLDLGLSAIGLGGVGSVAGDAMDLYDAGKAGVKGIKGLPGFAKGLVGKGGGLLKGAGGLLKGAGGLAAGGVGALGSIAGGIGSAATGVAGAAGGIAKGAGGILGKAGGLLGGVGAKGLAKGVLGKLGPIAMLAMAGYDAYQGAQDADNISGAGDKGRKATTGEKIKSGAAGALSGLTMGLIDPKTVYKGMESAFGPIIGEDGIFAQYMDMGDKLKDNFKDGINIKAFSKTFTDIADTVFGKEGILSKTVQMLGKLVEWSPLGMIAKGVNWLTNKATGQDTSISEKVSSIAPKGMNEWLGMPGFSKKDQERLGSIKQLDKGEMSDLEKSAQKGGFISPTGTDKVNVTSGFGVRAPPSSGATMGEKGSTIHRGLDIAASMGSTIVSPISGRVSNHIGDTDASSFVEVTGDDGITTRHHHVKAIAKDGDLVEPGTPIATVSTKGSNMGPHQHFEVMQGGKFVNPEAFLKAAKVETSGKGSSIAAVKPEGADSIAPATPPQTTDTATAPVSVTPSGGQADIETQGSPLVNEEAQQNRVAQTAMVTAANAGPKVIVIPSQNKEQSRGVPRSTQIDDVQLAILNSTMLEG